jgi:membrane-bound lytic murein transglycosylase D
VQIAAAPHPSRGRIPHLLAPAALAGLVAAVLLVALSSNRGPAPATRQAVVQTSRQRRPPLYWTIRPGDTLTAIARRTHVSVDRLEALNPNVNPLALAPGERVYLRPPPPHKPARPAPRWWRVRPGDSFGLIAARTRIDIGTLESLNPELKPATLQPGDRVRLRP